uniref:Uncharacterized protein AlNc14C65G4653 n=1 Tax=Albugo laibachii Nc14 TaxID=890382 RepID=F0WDD3_9STRA|nr:conserved hypothetical protein [Albugo laibachii Nc14]|eukprot:CCA19205.1 conserved hypothetical protein [Albugo laibachii Nc14]
MELLELLVHFNRTLCISLPSALATTENVKSIVEEREGVPAPMLELYVNGYKLAKDAQLPILPSIIRARVARGLLGGKGGFGAMLRSMGKGSGSKATRDFGACRDLNGRRLRHVNQELAIQKWQDEKDNREQQKRLGISERELMIEDTPSGIPGWYLPTPSWSEGIKKSHMRRQRNTKMCQNWLKARQGGREPPKNAPRWWGCPRGRQCDFAHGEEELRGLQLTEHKRLRKEEEDCEKQCKQRRYIEYEKDMRSDLADAVQQGLSRRGKLEGRKNMQELGSTCQVDKAKNDRTSWLESINDSLALTFRYGLCEVRGTSNFGTATASSHSRIDGRWYYEVKLITAGVVQVGWAGESFHTNSDDGDGVGDHVRSWAYDGCRVLKWTEGKDLDYGEQWEAGDIIGCMIDLWKGQISYTKNGKSLGVAFDNVNNSSSDERFFPAVSAEEKQILLMNVGGQPMQFLPDGYSSLQGTAHVPKIVEDGSQCEVTAIKSDMQDRDRNTIKAESPIEAAEKDRADWSKFTTAKDLEQLGLETLKEILKRRGLKCGGNLEQRAARLFSIKNKAWDEIDAKIKATVHASQER